MGTIKPTLKEIKPMTVAYIKMKGHFNQIPTAFGKLYSWITENGYKPHGPAIAVYYNIPETITILKNLLKQINEGVPFKNNRAKKLAADLYCRLPVIYGAEITAEVAHRWKTQLNENGKSWAFHEVFPELNHNAVVGYQIPQEISAKITVVLLESNLLSEPVKKRFLLTGKLLEKAGVSYVSIKSFGISPLSQIMSLILTGDFVSYFLAILNKKDPTPVEAIDFLKSKLSLG